MPPRETGCTRKQVDDADSHAVAPHQCVDNCNAIADIEDSGKKARPRRRRRRCARAAPERTNAQHSPRRCHPCQVFCRCWKSKTFPYCDGSHVAVRARLAAATLLQELTLSCAGTRRRSVAAAAAQQGHGRQPGPAPGAQEVSAVRPARCRRLARTALLLFDV
jgi:CDGSH-type Zn-finger protein